MKHQYIGALTPEAFQALAELMRHGDTPSAVAARFYFVDGLTPTEASKAVGCGIKTAENAIARGRRAIDRARKVADGLQRQETSSIVDLTV